MKTAKIVIGANFGDEGKGMVTDYFAQEAEKNLNSCLVVLHNGGCQRGHTVVLPSGLRHVFHHFGSGTFARASTYLAPEFIVNPIIFNKEYNELARKEFTPKCFIDENCRVTTPFDMIINQILEESRGENKHGSCGLGIFETIVRSKGPFNMTVRGFDRLNWHEKVDFLNEIAVEYLPRRLKEAGLTSIPIKWLEVLSNKDNIIKNYIEDFKTMASHGHLYCYTTAGILNVYDYVIFENGQGLLLDQNNTEYMPHLTPSNTGLKNPRAIIGDRKVDMEVCYVSRTYMTRHGVGRFDSECKKEEINPKMVDLTNVPNEFQGGLRYGTLDLDDLYHRLVTENLREGLGKTFSLVLTHCNEYPVDLNTVTGLFDGCKIYASDGMTCLDIHEVSE